MTQKLKINLIFAFLVLIILAFVLFGWYTSNKQTKLTNTTTNFRSQLINKTNEVDWFKKALTEAKQKNSEATQENSELKAELLVLEKITEAAKKLGKKYQNLQLDHAKLIEFLATFQKEDKKNVKAFDELNEKYLSGLAELQFIRSLIDQYLLAAWNQDGILISTIYYELGSSWNWQADEKNKLKLIFSEINKINKNDFFVLLRGHSDILKFLKNHKRSNLNLSVKRASHLSWLLSDVCPELTIKVYGVSEHESKERKVEIWVLPITQINLVDALVNIKKEIS